MKDSIHVAYFCGDNWEHSPYFSPKSFLAALKEMRPSLERNMPLFDEYLYKLLRAVNRLVIDPADQGFKAGEHLLRHCLKDYYPADAEQLLYTNRYICFIDHVDTYYKQALEQFKEEYSFACKNDNDLDRLDDLYKKLSKVLGEGVMEWLLDTIRNLFVVKPPTQLFRQGYMRHCLMVMSGVHDDSHPIWFKMMERL